LKTEIFLKQQILSNWIKQNYFRFKTVSQGVKEKLAQVLVRNYMKNTF